MTSTGADARGLRKINVRPRRQREVYSLQPSAALRQKIRQAKKGEKA